MKPKASFRFRDLLLNLGAGDDVAEYDFGSVSGELQSRIFGGLGDDQISTSFADVLTDAEARSVMFGGFGDDVMM